MSDSFSVKPLLSAHAQQVSDLHLLIWQEAYAPIFGKEHLQHLPREESRRDWQARLQREQYVGIGLWKQEQLVGFAGWGALTAARAEIYHFYLDPEVRGEGTAHRFMHFLLGQFREKGYEEVILWVLKDNQRAKHFYQKEGFIPTQKEQVRYKWGLTLQEDQYSRTTAK